ncbi:MMPL family transporter [Stackebrandtia nassauensis]|uniref:MMPL domain protein n=1 Tax=Stackebrandtia nassauensis (strain DSM 44728 / CIP 108903 / NRRL B-16338 / NBRC 102104 / LLR-40K-21) TaxID=446470 RepID=D3PZH4_STANL|nr:MMPL family transporter [Stackebrandtia nassauensis]ADD41648.1 MMPL domain protein [Stackebrandtia nassauensis DSM 44728]
MHTNASPPRTFTVRMASWSAVHPWRAILVWIGFVAVVFGVGSAMGTQQTEFSDFWVGEAGEAEAMAEDADIAAPAVEKVLITAKDGKLDPELAAKAAADVEKRMDALTEVSDIAGPETSKDGESVLVSLTMSMPAHEAPDHIEPLLETTEAVQADHPDVNVRQTGDESVSHQLDNQLGSDLGRAELFTMPITLIILFAVFGSLLLAGVPLLLAISSIMASMGIYAIASHFFPDAGGAVTSVLVMMGMAVGVDYSLFYVKRVREERERNGSLSQAAAVELAARTSGHAILVSGVAVVVSMAGLYLSGDVIFYSIATACVIVVAVAMISSLTVLPALLAKMGKRVDGRRRRARKPARLWPAMLRPVMNHPVASVLIGGLVLVALAAPALGIKLSVEGKETFPKSLPTLATYDEMTEAFPDKGVLHKVVARVDAEHTDELAATMRRLWEETSDNELFSPTTEPRLLVSKDERTAALELPVPYPTSDDRAARSLELLRGDLVPKEFAKIDGAEFAVSGEPAYAHDYSELQATHLFWVVGFVLVATFVMMLIAFRSVVLAAVGLGLNLLSVLAAWGSLVLVFQGEWAEGLLGFDSPGFIGSRTPLMVFTILFGLSLDYQIFVISRIREHALRGESTRQAAYNGILSSAGVVSSAAIIMVSVFAAFMLIDRIEMKQLGFTLALGVLLDAVVVRILILPALLSLLDRKSWWPSALSKQPEPSDRASGATDPVTVRA